jgi:hypothetical protein
MSSVVAKKPRKNPYLVTFSLSFSNIVSLHFGSVSTYLVDKSDIQRASKTTSGNTIVPVKSDIYHEQDLYSKRIIYFFDTKKERIKAWPVMVEAGKDGVLALYTKNPCRNCHHTYEGHPIGCPIRYHPHTSMQTMNNVHTAHLIEIRDKIVTFLKNNNLSIETNDFFETEKAFCSFPCVKSYILECLSNNSKSYRYQKSLSYLTLLYKKLYDVSILPVDIPKAPPIDVLETYGGHLTISEYRESFGVVKYTDTHNTKRPYMFSTVGIIEETKLKGSLVNNM